MHITTTSTLLLLSTLTSTALTAPLANNPGTADKEVGPGTWIPLGNYKDAVEKRATAGTADKEVGPGTWIPLGNYKDAVEKRGNADKEVGPETWIPLDNYKDAVEKRATAGTADKEVGPETWIPLGNYVDAVEKRGNADKEVGPEAWCPYGCAHAVEKRSAHEGAIAPATISYDTIAYDGAVEKRGNADEEVGPGTWIPLGNYKDAVEKREAHEGAVAPATISYDTIAYDGAAEK